MNLGKLTCTAEQSRRLTALGIEPISFLQFFPALKAGFIVGPRTEDANYTGNLPAWTKAELDVLIGPQYAKPDFYPLDRITRATDPLTFPVFFPERLLTFKNPAEASAAGLIYILENNFIYPVDCNERYKNIFL